MSGVKRRRLKRTQKRKEEEENSKEENMSLSLISEERKDGSVYVSIANCLPARESLLLLPTRRTFPICDLCGGGGVCVSPLFPPLFYVSIILWREEDFEGRAGQKTRQGSGMEEGGRRQAEPMKRRRKVPSTLPTQPSLNPEGRSREERRKSEKMKELL